MNISQVGPAPGASQTVGGSTLPASPTFRQIFMKSGSSQGLYACSSSGTWTGPLSATTGDVVGPGSSTDNAIARFDGPTGKLIQNSVVAVADTTGVITGTQGITISGATSGTIALSASATGGNLVVGNLTVTNPGSPITATLPSTSFTVARTDAANTFTGTQTFSGQISSNLATGTAAFSVSSTTPVANLHTSPISYLINGTQFTGGHFVTGSATLSTGSATVTLTGSAIYSSSSSYFCFGSNQTAANAVKVTYSSGSSFTITGTGSDVINFICFGN